MRIAILVEGRTERAFRPHLQKFLQTRLHGNMPAMDFVPYDGPLPKAAKLRREVQRLLSDRRNPANAVIALTDVYTGSQPPEFATAVKAKLKLQQWVGDEPRFFPHVALHDFEAWLLPYWDRIQKLAGSNRKRPGPHPEMVNHDKPPADHLKEIFREKGKTYSKTITAGQILKDADLLVSINACPELKALINTIIKLCDEAQSIP